MSGTPIVDRRPDNPRACCILCATWVCHECWDFRRNGANRSRSADQICNNCGGIEGEFLAVRHRDENFHYLIYPQWFAWPIPTQAQLPKTREEVERMKFYGTRHP